MQITPITKESWPPQNPPPSTVVTSLIEVGEGMSKFNEKYFRLLAADGTKYYVWTKHFADCLNAIRSCTPADQVVLVYRTSEKGYNNVLSMAVLQNTGAAQQAGAAPQADLSLNEMTALTEGTKA